MAFLTRWFPLGCAENSAHPEIRAHKWETGKCFILYVGRQGWGTLLSEYRVEYRAKIQSSDTTLLPCSFCPSVDARM